MPIYEYHCKACKNQFEVLTRTNDDKTAYKCPECGTTDTKKRFSAFAAMGTNKDVAKVNDT